jgi:ABC-type branched-subunit amino acid transport system substrate-binding protein
LLTLANYTDFNKVAILAQDNSAYNTVASILNEALPGYGFSIVYNSKFAAAAVTDFSSYFSAIEASGAQVFIPLTHSQATISLAKEYTDRHAPFVVWGSIAVAMNNDFWNWTEGKCKYMSGIGQAIESGYPLTSKTVPTREAYINRWGQIPATAAASAYDLVRFVLPEAITRAGTTETEAVIRALENTNVETSLTTNFAFTSSHDVMIGKVDPEVSGENSYIRFCMFQWQNGTQTVVYPEELMIQAGSTYIFPDWPGPWSNT